MPKKEVERLPERSGSSGSKLNVEKALIDNFVGLQRVMTNMSIKFDDLTKKISRLLELFEISAKEIAEKNYGTGDGNFSRREVDEISERVNQLLEQNRIIAKGISLLHENPYAEHHESNQHEIQPLPKSPTIESHDGRKGAAIDMLNYEKSISSMQAPPAIVQEEEAESEDEENAKGSF